MLTRNVFIEKHGNLYAKKGKKIKVAVRLFCGECMGMSRTKEKIEYPQDDVIGCTDPMCPLFEWRLGKNPYPSQNMVERGKKLAARMKQ